MVAKKYLCNAPRQEVWDEKVEAMLKSMRGTMKQKRSYLRKTLKGLQDEHGHEKRSGPGRKSNAYYALTYFEYALSKAGGSMDDDDDSSSSSSSSSESEEEADQEEGEDGKPKAKSSGSSSSKSHDAEEEKTIESMDSQEFLNEHNDLCDVCNEGGELLCCSTCNLVFHLGCLRPALGALPKGDWSCPYCILSGTPVAIPDKPQKDIVRRNSKMWKPAAVGVRQMGRLRTLANQKKDGKGSSNEKASDDTVVNKGGQHPNTTTPAKKTEDEDAKTPQETPQLRGKRSRRQVTLYDPQDGPASEWKSDEQYAADHAAAEEKHHQQQQQQQQKQQKGEEQQQPMSRKRRRMERKKQEETEESSQEGVEREGDDDDNDSSASAFCKFCNDDKKIPLCVFCGCRVCFGKKDKEKLLLCDGCDEEYHTYCLDPPLTSAPKASATWHCPSCTKEKTTTRTHKTRRSSAAKAAVVVVASPPAPAPKSASKPTSTGRPRGRPPKNASANSPVNNSATTPTTTPKRRGRPPKSATKAAQAAAAAAAAETPAPRKRGRPPKNASTTPGSSDSSKRKQAPPSSAKKARTTTPAPTSSPISAARKVTTLPSVVAADNVSRSGRVLKATSKQQARTDQQQGQHQQQQQAHGIKDGTAAAKARAASVAKAAVAKKTVPAVPSVQVKQVPKPKTKYLVPTAVQKSAPVTTQLKSNTPKAATNLPVKVSVPVPHRTTLPQPAAVGHKPAVMPQSTIATSAKAQGAQGPAATKAAVAATPSSAVAGSVPKVVTAAAKPSPASTGVKKQAAAPAIANNKAPTISVPTRQPQGKLEIRVAPIVAAVKKVAAANPRAKLDVPSLVAKAIRQSAAAARADMEEEEKPSTAPAKAPRRKPGARECMQISRRFGLRVISQKYMDTLLDYCTRGKVEHLIRMRERLDEHSRFLEAQLAGLEAVVREVGESDVVVPALPDRPDNKPHNAPASR